MSHQLGLQANRYKLEIRDLKIDYDSLNDEYKLIRENKDKEILALQEELKKYSSKKPGWWFAAGVAIGVGGTAALAVQLTR
jgi:predicted AlkP superfamily phosphohydrolase/phosphomutase